MSRAFSLAPFALCLGLLALPGTAAAQASFDLQLFRPSAHGDSFFSVESGAIKRSLDVRASLYLNYAYRPLLLLNESGAPISSMDHRFDLNIMGAIALFDRLSLALSIPATLYQGGSLPTGSAAQLAAVAFGDIRFEPKVGILDQKRHFIDIAVLLGLTIPTGNRSSFAGDRTFTAYGELDVGRRFGPFRLAGNFGFLWREKTVYYDLLVGPELYYRLGFGFDIGWYAKKAPIELILEGYGRTSAERPFRSEAQNPLEVLFGLRYQPLRWFALQAGAGRGLLAGYGAPVVRAFLGLTFIPLSKLQPQPLPEPPVILPASAPASVPVLPPPPPDTDGDGFLDADDKCPKEAEDKDGFQDEDGCPEDDNDQDGIKDTDDQCPNEAEVVNGVDDFDGCPDKGRSLVVVMKDQIQILEKVKFQKAKDTILPDSYGLLNQVANTLKNHAEIKRMRVEGHTDSDGPDLANLKLSQRRADAVRKYLVAQGVQPERLDAVGYGESRPIAPNASKRGKEQNRRVAFMIIDAETQLEAIGGSSQASDLLPPEKK